ncbi:hypothetical protein BKA69DRAFT_1107193 [Paraphysoderma sedebokerense]|nr:hypothetical protein BKA69DRAFT_1107193 [Paraphysoderma sedebokerense]
MRSVIVQVLILALCGIAVGAEFQNFDTLEQNRKHIKFISYTPSDRKQVAQVAKSLISIYVNRESKITFLGKEVDPVPLIEDVYQKAEQLSDEEFHIRLSKIFTSLRDFHTNYIFPEPYACFRAALPLTFAEVYSTTTERKAVVKSIGLEDPSYQKFAPETEKIQIGDELVSYNGKGLQQLFDEQVSLAGGANNFGGFASVLSRLTFIAGSIFVFPEENSAILEFKKYSDGTKYSVTLPWLSWTRDCDLTSSSSLKLARKEPINMKRPISVNPLQSEFNSAYKSPPKSSVLDVQPGLDGTVKWSVIENRNGKFGYILFTSFVPESGQSELVYESFRSLILKEFSDTDGLILDIRGNGGGYADIADTLPLLFSSKPYQTTRARALNAPLNRKIFLNSSASTSADPWYQAFQNVKPNAVYTENVAFTLEQKALLMSKGQFYFKPVAILTNANCYSACDIFSALMQDYGIATIYGEDLLTGAGGANVVDVNSFFSSITDLASDFYLPDDGKQNMRIGWRQIVRGGKNAGRLIEDRGVVADRRARPTVDDIVGKTQSQFDKITADLKYQSTDYPIHFKTDQSHLGTNEFRVGEAVKFTGEIKSINKLLLKRYPSRTLIGEVTINNSRVKSDFSLSSSISKEPFQSTVIIEGVSGGEVVLRTLRNVRVVPTETINESFQWDFTPKSGIAIYNLLNDPLDGWIKKGDSMVLGDGVSYKNLVDSRITLFLDLTRATTATLSFDLELDSEPLYDKFTVKVNTKFEALVDRDGEVRESVKVDLTEFVGQKVEIEIGFKSDEFTVRRGAKLSRFKLVIA